MGQATARRRFRPDAQPKLVVVQPLVEGVLQEALSLLEDAAEPGTLRLSDLAWRRAPAAS